jgi:hypothetical protein
VQFLSVVSVSSCSKIYLLSDTCVFRIGCETQCMRIVNGETRSGGRVEVAPMGTGGLFATSRHSRLRRVQFVVGGVSDADVALLCKKSYVYSGWRRGRRPLPQSNRETRGRGLSNLRRCSSAKLRPPESFTINVYTLATQSRNHGGKLGSGGTPRGA